MIAGRPVGLNLERCRHELAFPRPLRLRVGDRFVFLPSIETAIAWLQPPADVAARYGMEASLELLIVARDSRSPDDVNTSYRAFSADVARAQLLFR
ncbi:MAG: hypothetical protein KIT36_17705 [Alphaproteobacteria bacterium]|nr:hypothetical protein [Alphaproteobacteria bacterium]